MRLRSDSGVAGCGGTKASGEVPGRMVSAGRPAGGDREEVAGEEGARGEEDGEEEEEEEVEPEGEAAGGGARL
jgi:hypothetical protein